MDEFQIINRYFRRDSISRFPLSVGDDCALIDVPTGQQLAMSIDSLVEGVHFFHDDRPDLIASRALCVSLSDLAAMGAEPSCFTLSLSLPKADEEWLTLFSQGLFNTADQYGCELIGGDTVCGPLVISIQVHGTVPRGAAMKRSAAQLGDLVCVSGTLGDGAASLAVLKQQIEVGQADHRYLKDRYYQPQPRFDVAMCIRDFANAAIDISDGLVADLNHICEASRLAACISTETLPLSHSLLSCATERQRRDWPLYGGDDYQLCFTIPPEKYALLSAQHDGLDIVAVGRMGSGKGVYCETSQELLTTKRAGYQHFGDTKEGAE